MSLWRSVVFAMLPLCISNNLLKLNYVGQLNRIILSPFVDLTIDPVFVLGCPVGTPGVKMRICPPYPQRVVKGDWNGVVYRNNHKKGDPVSMLRHARERTLRNVYGVGSPTVGPTSSVRLHIYVSSHIWLKYRCMLRKQPISLTHSWVSGIIITLLRHGNSVVDR